MARRARLRGPDQHEIVETAIREGTYEGEGRVSEAMNDLLDTLHVRPSSSRSPPFDYEGRVYRWSFRGGE